MSDNRAVVVEPAAPGRLVIRPVPEPVPDRGEAIASRVAQVAGHVLGWDADRQAAEVTTYLEGARREYGIPG